MNDAVFLVAMAAVVLTAGVGLVATAISTLLPAGIKSARLGAASLDVTSVGLMAPAIGTLLSAGIKGACLGAASLDVTSIGLMATACSTVLSAGGKAALLGKRDCQDGSSKCWQQENDVVELHFEY